MTPQHTLFASIDWRFSQLGTSSRASETVVHREESVRQVSRKIYLTWWKNHLLPAPASSFMGSYYAPIGSGLRTFSTDTISVPDFFSKQLTIWSLVKPRSLQAMHVTFMTTWITAVMCGLMNDDMDNNCHVWPDENQHAAIRTHQTRFW
ncbi:hypothetical protein PR048_024922 [Dryococelus australis]|uniref:Uncharacterized protein n=1 Tax=Dryococelus australis TaxID=614101 RepID=A0ABQ9GPV8_9NEOP|nr:hypothetical protein PR048_024922 [Dryococelus australis]